MRIQWRPKASGSVHVLLVVFLVGASSLVQQVPGLESQQESKSGVKSGWIRVHPQSSPGPRTDPLPIKPAGSSNSFWIGGTSETAPLNDSWEYAPDREEWFVSPTFGAPPADEVDAARVVYVPERNSLLTLGEQGVWTLNLTSRRWTALPTNVPDLPSSSYSIAHHPRVGLVIVFGGGNSLQNSSGNLTFVYNASANLWSKLAIVGENPPPLYRASMVYVDSIDRMILFGGSSTIPDPETMCSQRNGTWEFDLQNLTWTRLHPKVSPAPRVSNMVSLPSVNRLFLFSGQSCLVEYQGLGDTWAFDYQNMTWYDLKPNSFPLPLSYHGLYFDQLSNSVVLFGGIENLRVHNQTWHYTVGPETANPPVSNPPVSQNWAWLTIVPYVILAVMTVIIVLVAARRRSRRRQRQLERAGTVTPSEAKI